MREKVGQYHNYIVIGAVSCVALFVLPFIGSEAGLAFNIPNTAAGWIVYVAAKVSTAVINIVLFHCFTAQGKEEAMSSKTYQEAVKILSECTEKATERPRSPREWSRAVYGRKLVLVALASILGAFSIAQAVLVFDWVLAISHALTIVGGLVFGLISHDAAKRYWEEEFWRYAKMKEDKTDEH